MSVIKLQKDGTLAVEEQGYQILGQGSEPIVIVDSTNKFWLIDPAKGTMREIKSDANSETRAA